MFQIKVVDKNQNTHFMFNNFFFFRPRRLSDDVKKYYRAGHATDVNVAHAHCMLDTKGYKHTLRICNTYCFSTTTMVARTRLNITLYVHCLSSFKRIVISGTGKSALLHTVSRVATHWLVLCAYLED